ncbi:MAG: Ig-like domain-containing protein, partial [Candidatus Thermoplasmatota archaeon]
SVSPANGAANVPLDEYVVIMFSEAMNTATVAVTFSPNPGNLLRVWSSGYTVLTIAHANFAGSTTYTITVTAGRDRAGNNLATLPYPWSFTTEALPSGGSTGNVSWGLSPAGPNYDKSAVTESVDLRNVERATLSFWHKYNIVSGVNGGALLLGWKDSATAPFKYRYIVPSSAYTGNLRLNETETDSFGTRILWCWNGVSAEGTFDWEYVSLDILPYLPSGSNGTYEYRSAVRVKFAYYQYGGGTGYGWYIDDVKITVSRSDAVAPTATDADVWRLVSIWDPAPWGSNHSAYSYNYSWWNGDPTTGWMKEGIDNALITMPIDLTNARYAELSAYFRFNINTSAGRPPDGFKVEISLDNGVTWNEINLGVRAAWSVSGAENDASDGKIDGKSYTGIGTYGGWVEAGTLTRLNVVLTPFAGNAIFLRFRVVNTNHPAYLHYDDPAAGFGGFYIDDVIVHGETIQG